MLLSFTTLLNGCAIMSKDDCLSANWPLIGQHDGISGAGSLMQKRGEACAKHKILIDRDQYTDGYKKGLKTYCNPQAVFDYALQGKGNYQSCPLEMHNELRPYYNVANNYYQAKKGLDSVEKNIASARSSLERSGLDQKSRDYYRSIISENSELLPQVRRNFQDAERSLQQFKQTQNFNY